MLGAVGDGEEEVVEEEMAGTHRPENRIAEIKEGDLLAAVRVAVEAHNPGDKD